MLHALCSESLASSRQFHPPLHRQLPVLLSLSPCCAPACMLAAR